MAAAYLNVTRWSSYEVTARGAGNSFSMSIPASQRISIFTDCGW